MAVRNKPGRISNFSWFKIWEPDGTSTVEGPLNAPEGCVPVGERKLTIRGTVPARRLGRRGKPIVVATGSRVARAAGTLTVRLRLNSTGRKRVRRLKGARLTVRVRQGARSATKVVKLR